ncbi:hypothetical protein LTR67_008050 [Exophiala xenobiotica]
MGSIGEPEATLERILAKYEEERQKRLRSDGLAQFADIINSDKFKHFAEDPWVTTDNEYVTDPISLPDGGHTKVLILGAGFGALLYAARLITIAGYTAEDILLVDSAWGFGGSWYWNRYPGLMCDVESSCYMPLLEEVGYVPKHRYAYGPELQSYAELVAAKYNLKTRAAFGSTISSASWDEKSSEWVYTIKRQIPNKSEESVIFRSDVFILASGILNRPKLARVDGLDGYKGHMFHTSRWDYGYTGGSPETPDLEKLKDKKVAFIGTGATAIQAVPQLAKWVKELYVFQRTPSAVDVRGQSPIDPEHWRKEIVGKKGWQRERRENMAAFLSNGPSLPVRNLVDDGWTRFPSFSAVVGSPKAAGLTLNNSSEYATSLHHIDLQRQERIRARAGKIVRDQQTAEALKPWYPGWCKRPCFHDEYLDAYNLPNVQLVDTAGKGIDGFYPQGLKFNGEEFEADVVILGTGFESYSVGSPAFRAGLTITGRDQLSLDDKWKNGIGTLHGVFTRGFPNLILSGLTQAGATVNVVHTMDVLATHFARILAQAKKESSPQKKLLIEPSLEGEESWSLKIAAGALAFGAQQGCTPSYANAEGATVEDPRELAKAARGGIWSLGIVDFIELLEAWETKGTLEGLEISAV